MLKVCFNSLQSKQNPMEQQMTQQEKVTEYSEWLKKLLAELNETLASIDGQLAKKDAA